ncbi:peroxinectin [Tieghemostelium lacteum]|uniref:Peroxinectin n=1 Tax=Tieghemostelium lacteum TaxID=361077 RepID=A0A152A3Y6_TIELA|nr:peroxinectin [Tieghemostelium lacteum]|eukprot:KYR00934.1 peroxinectin [Tieghemostelium lacteum]
MKFIKSILIVVVVFIGLIKTQPTEWRSYNGEGNNIKNKDLGIQYGPFGRLMKPKDFKAFSKPDFYNNLPMVREVSNMLCNQESLIMSTEHLTDMFNMWGQFLIHNLALSKPLSLRWDIPVPKCDFYFDPQCTGTKNMTYIRTRITEVPCTDLNTPDASDGKCYEQVNTLSSFIDANVVYGSDKATCVALRQWKDGLMISNITDHGELPPLFIPGVSMDNDANIYPVKDLFYVGERRGNENPGLMSLHVIFLREHNRMAKVFKGKHSEWSDEDIFQHTRSCVIEQIQKITYEEYLPIVLGGPLPSYSGYNPDLSPLVSNEFTTAAFRYGHSEVGPNIEYIDENGQRMSPLPIRHSYFNPKAMDIAGAEPILRGLIYNEEQAIDLFVISDLRNFLFGNPGSGGFDLVCRNLQRNRDHGIPLYNEVRQNLGLRPVKTWSDITSNIATQNRLKNAYGDVNLIELFVGGLAEDHYENSVVGQTFYTILREQFLRTRLSDRFWYERDEIKKVNSECEPVSFSELVRRNTKNMNNLPANLFKIVNHYK